MLHTKLHAAGYNDCETPESDRSLSFQGSDEHKVPDEIDLSDGPVMNAAQVLASGLSLIEIKSFKDIAHLGAGCSFGEMSLVSGKPRMATLKTLNKCHLMVLTKENYEKCLKHAEVNKI